MIFTLYTDLMMIGCPQKTLAKDVPSVVQQKAVRVEVEHQAKEKEEKEKEKKRARAEAQKEGIKGEFERSLVAQKTPSIEGKIFGRANSAKRYLIFLGIASDSISTISYGEERPLGPAQNEEAWTKKRRAQFVILSK